MAALSVSSRRLPGMTQRNVLPIASIPWGGYNRPIELPQLETFPGAACYQPNRAARLQSGSPPGVRSAQPAACLRPFCVPSSSFKRSGVSGLASSSSNSGERSVGGLEFWSTAPAANCTLRPRGWMRPHQAHQNRPRARARPRARKVGLG
jgi:hypothetical protein